MKQDCRSFCRFLTTFLHCIIQLNANDALHPHVIFIMADDLGFNDVSFHGSGQIPTPNIDALAYSGLILNNYYVPPVCTPSRSALMTGKYPIHTGTQHSVIHGAERRGLPLTEKLMPEYFNDLGYSSHMVGKWHLGSYKKEYTPTYRGFESHLGMWLDHHDYFDHTCVEYLQPQWGLDMHRNLEAAYDLHGKYSTEVFTEEAVRIISSHDERKPLFLYLAHVAPHAGNDYDLLPAPDDEVAKFKYIKDSKRARLAAILSLLDKSVGQVVEALKARRMLNNSIIVFTTDNGGAAGGLDGSAASNFPLRSGKASLFEGGVRGTGLIWSPEIRKPERVASQLMHMVDWLPTLLHAIGANNSTLRSDIDGINLWNQLSKDEPSPRSEILHNIDDISSTAGLTMGNWKYVKGISYGTTRDNWYGPSGRDYTYNISLVLQSQTGQALSAMNRRINSIKAMNLRTEATINCTREKSGGNMCNLAVNPCLFNIKHDPCETNNLADKYPEKVKKLEDRIRQLNAGALPPGNTPLDPVGDPKNWNYVWTNFGDFS